MIECMFMMWGIGIIAFVFGIVLASRGTGLDNFEQEELTALRAWYRGALIRWPHIPRWPNM